jgi:predicted transposase/invertase (TIGR01784 family)
MSKKSNLRKLITFDWAVKRLLRDKANFGILEGFLSELLKQDILIEEVLESETNRETEDDKQIIVDLLCKTTMQELVLIEIQYARQLAFFHRMAFGTAKIMAERMKKGEDYNKVVKIYSVNLEHFNLGSGNDYVYHAKTEFRGLHTNDILRNSDLQIDEYQKEFPGDIFPEYYLIRIEQFNDLAKTTLDEWIWYLKNGTLPKKFQAKGLSLVAEKMKEDQMNVEELKAYQKFKDRGQLDKASIEYAFREGELKGELKGVIRGKLEGKEEAIIESIISAYQNGVDIPTIAKIFSLSEDAVLDILKRHGAV